MKALGGREGTGRVQPDRAGPGPGFGRHFGECWGGAGRADPQKALVVARTVSAPGLH